MSATASVLNRPDTRMSGPRGVLPSLLPPPRTNVAVLSGIHYEDLTGEQIQEVDRVCGALVNKVLPIPHEQAHARPPAKDLFG